MKVSRLMVGLALASSFASASMHAAEALQGDALAQKITQLDSEAFDAFNHCSDPAQLERHAHFFSESVEFYHDNGGVSWNRAEMLANTKKYACANYTREVIPGSIVVYPIKDFGAIELGSHRFCQTASKKCEGIADFTMVWQQTDAGWKITRVLSYGHRANPGAHQ
ncbi:hypothetical protein GCM10011487_26610 [Steroidobacter agaridevorans]|uniref:DUF4440 domain-containing protein n=1 Tax=Steroidobacter agaridevorans TaxID=2695856 RepID=A0A829YCU1_9GAMM|nr:nuclear transport factor 2 family protein [Steroidobacter agaridevorans]GFE80661.1 hypothetical protein GCM10011487_26610 [Steroidobacter agaridevorans]